MASDLRRQMAAQFFKARDEYISAIRAHSDALAAMLETEAEHTHLEYERISAELQRKHDAYRQATDDVKAVNSREQ